MKTKIKNINVLQTIYCFFLLFILIFIHCYKIGDIPYGINVDEMGMAYDAWCLSNFGTDRYLNSYPVYLINYSGGQSAMYAYLCAPFIYFFGFSSTIIRIPAIIFSIITFWGVIQIGKYIWNNNRINLMVGLLYIVLPVFLLLSRIGLDCNLMLGMSTIFLCFLLKAIEKGKNKDFVIAGIFGGLVLYTYVISHMVLPFFLFLTIIFLLYTGKINYKQIICVFIPIIILGMPLMLMHFINMFDLEETKIGIFTVPKLYRYRSDDIDFKDIGKNVIGILKNTLLYDNVRFNSIIKYGNLYFVSIPFIVLGLIYNVKETIVTLKDKTWNPSLIMLFWMFSVYATGILISDGGPNVYRVNSIFIPYLFFIVQGILLLYYFIKKFKEILAKCIVCIVIIIYMLFFTSFINYYFNKYTKDTYLLDLFNFTFEDVLVHMEKNLPEGVSDRTTYIGDGNQTYMYYLVSTITTPYEYNKLEDDEPYTLWLWTQKYKNYEFNFPEQINPAGNYIVPETSKKYIEEFEKYGLKKEHIGTHYFFWNDIIGKDESNTQAMVSWDHGIVDGKIALDNENSTVISGWALDSDAKRVWDDIILVADYECYVADKMERKDVANVFQNNELISSGFHIEVPSKNILNKNIKIIFIDYESNEYYVEKYVCK